MGKGRPANTAWRVESPAASVEAAVLADPDLCGSDRIAPSACRHRKRDGDQQPVRSARCRCWLGFTTSTSAPP